MKKKQLQVVFRAAAFRNHGSLYCHVACLMKWIAKETSKTKNVKMKSFEEGVLVGIMLMLENER
ncbi:hypothetical protein KAW50_03450 [candidate division WOR-3 bacterium]|nr:hypothetical protein [candidate division WOR-3 bacterium]